MLWILSTVWCVFAAVDYWSYILVYKSEVPGLISSVANNEDSMSLH